MTLWRCCAGYHLLTFVHVHHPTVPPVDPAAHADDPHVRVGAGPLGQHPDRVADRRRARRGSPGWRHILAEQMAAFDVVAGWPPAFLAGGSTRAAPDG